MTWFALLSRPGREPSDTAADRARRAEAAARKLISEEKAAEMAAFSKAMRSGGVSNILSEPLDAFVAPFQTPDGWSVAALSLRPQFPAPPDWVPSPIRGELATIPQKGIHVIRRATLREWLRVLPGDGQAIRQIVAHHLASLGLSANEIRNWQSGFGQEPHWPIPGHPPDHYGIDATNPAENSAAYGSFLAVVREVGDHAIASSCDVRLSLGIRVRVDAFDYEALQAFVKEGDKEQYRRFVSDRLEKRLPEFMEIQKGEQARGFIHNWLDELPKRDVVSLTAEWDFLFHYIMFSCPGLSEAQLPSGDLARRANAATLRRMKERIASVAEGFCEEKVQRELAEALDVTPDQVREVLSIMDEGGDARKDLKSLQQLVDRALKDKAELILAIIE